MAKRRTTEFALSQFQEDLQTLSIREAVGGLSKRSLPKSRRLLEDLSGFRASEIAQSLGLRTQKYVALRRQIEAGRVASPQLNDFLEQASKRLTEKPSLRTEEYTAEVPHKGKRVRETDVWEASSSWMRREAGWARDIKPGGFASRRSALNWLGNVGGAAEYFAVVRKTLKGGATRYHVYDIRTPEELANKGNVAGQTELKAAHKMEEAAREHKGRSRR